MHNRKGHLYFSLFLILISGYAIFSALGWSFKTKLFPLGTAIPILVVYLIGFPLTVPLFIFFFLKFQSEAGWLQSLALTAGTWIFFYLLFQRLVHIQFEAGAIQSWLGI